MSTFILMLAVAGIIYLSVFRNPQHHSEAELKKWFSTKLTEISTQLENDIEKDSNGEYPHAGKQSFTRRGAITYVLVDKRYARFDVSDKNALSAQDITETEGYRTLEQKAQSLNLATRLDEREVEGDGVDTFYELDEYIDDFPRYYTVTISGW